MDFDIFNIFFSIYQSFLQSNFFYYLKIFSAFVSIILFIDIILLLSKRIRTDWRMALYGTPVMRFKKSKYNVKWEAVEKRAAEGSVSGAKIALIEADKMLDEILGKLGYAGKDAEEKVKNIKPGQLVGMEDMKETQLLRNKIIENPAYEANFSEIKSALAVYKRVLRGLEALD
jgi:hypothetical protein